jgi:hypothetical protein
LRQKQEKWQEKVKKIWEEPQKADHEGKVFPADVQRSAA